MLFPLFFAELGFQFHELENILIKFVASLNLSGILCEGIINFKLKVHVESQPESTAQLGCKGVVGDFCLERRDVRKDEERNSRNGGSNAKQNILLSF